MKTQSLHMIGNAHIDPVWRWQEGFHEVKASFRSALDRMNEHDPPFLEALQASTLPRHV